MLLKHDRAALPWGSLKAGVQLAVLFTLLLPVECLRLTDRAPSGMHRCSVIGASLDVNLAQFGAVVSDSNCTPPLAPWTF